MTESEFQIDEQFEEPVNESTWNKLVSSPEVQGLISEGIKRIPDLIDTHIN